MTKRMMALLMVCIMLLTNLGVVDAGSINARMRTYPEIVDIIAGGYHSIAFDRSGDVYTFGSNRYGEMGLGTTSEEGVIYDTSVDDSGQALKVSSRGDHILTIGIDGNVYSWGYNNHGQLGTGNWTNQSSATVVNGLPDNVIDVAAGHQFSLALTEDGEVYSWGHGGYGQSGNGSTNDSNLTPVKVNISDVVQISAGHYHALAIKNDGTVWGWGRNSEGELGNSDGGNVSTPIQINIDNIKEVVAGFNNSFFITNDGYVYACGNNAGGELGDGTRENKTEPVLIDGISNVIQVQSNSCTVFLQDDGLAYGTGSNEYGQLGMGRNIGRVVVPTKIPGDGYTKVAAGGAHTLLYWGTTYSGGVYGGKIYAMGKNQYYQCGQNTDENIYYPTEVSHIQEIDDRETWAPIDYSTCNEQRNILFATEDTYISQNGSTNVENYSTDSLCAINYTRKENGSDDWGQYTYLKFDVNNIDKDKILSAKLYVYVDENSDTRSSTRTISVYDTEYSDWVASELTWSSGIVPEGDNLLGTFNVSGNGSIITDAGWREIDVSDYLKDYSGDYLSVIAKMTSSTPHPVSIRSSENYYKTAPVLVVDMMPDEYVTVENVSIDYENNLVTLSGTCDIIENVFNVTLENRYGNTYTYVADAEVEDGSYTASFSLEAPKFGENIAKLNAGSYSAECEFSFEVEEEKVDGKTFDSAINISCDKLISVIDSVSGEQDINSVYFSIYATETTSYNIEIENSGISLYVYDSEGNFVETNYTKGRYFNVTDVINGSAFVMNKGEKYFIEVAYVGKVDNKFIVKSLETISNEVEVLDVSVSNNNIELSANSGKMFRFIATENGVYDFEFKYQYNSIYSQPIDTQLLYDNNFMPIDMLPSCNNAGCTTWSIGLNYGESIFIWINNRMSTDISTILNIDSNNSYNYVNATNNSLNVGTTSVFVEQNEYYAFDVSPLNEGIYLLKTNSECDTVAYLYKGNELIRVSEYDTNYLDGKENLNFNLVEYLYENESYTIVIKNRGDSSNIDLIFSFLGYELPLNGGELDYTPTDWNNLEAENYNCYNYAMNIQGEKAVFLQPGRISQNEASDSDINDILQNKEMTCEEKVENIKNYFMTRCIADAAVGGNTFFEVNEDTSGYPELYKVALVLSIELNDEGEWVCVDYHWYRQNSDAKWSHKLGHLMVVNKDESYNYIYRPDCINCNTGTYNVFLGYFLTDGLSYNSVFDESMISLSLENSVPETKLSYRIDEFDFINSSTTRTQIIELLGNPNNSIGSGMIIHEYILENDERIIITYDFDNESIARIIIKDKYGNVSDYKDFEES